MIAVKHRLDRPKEQFNDSKPDRTHVGDRAR